MSLATPTTTVPVIEPDDPASLCFGANALPSDGGDGAQFGFPPELSPRTPWSAAAALCILLTVICGAGCGSSSSVIPSTTTSATAVVPGGAALTVKPGTPMLCAQLVHSIAIQHIGKAVAGLAETPATPGAPEQLHQAANALRSVSSGASVKLRDEITTAASALDALANTGAGSSATITATSASLTQLGKGVQSECDFPLS
jgi:hypothetical protein